MTVMRRDVADAAQKGPISRPQTSILLQPVEADAEHQKHDDTTELHNVAAGNRLVSRFHHCLVRIRSLEGILILFL